MEFVSMTKEEMAIVYNTYMNQDFPPEELKPLDSIYDMMDRNSYEPLRVYKDNKPVGYTLVTKVKNTEYLLLDYFAIHKEFRGQGLGSASLRHLISHYNDKIIFIEAENPEFYKDTPYPEKRLSFYINNGCKNTNILSKIWGVNYVNLYLSDKVIDTETSRSAINQIYETMVQNKEMRDKFVVIY